MEMGFVMVAAFGGGALLRCASRTIILVALVFFLLFAVNQTIVYRHHARDMLRPLDITTTVEYKAARWLQENLPGQRVFAAGSIQFWLNAFANNPQVGGGFSQGIVNQTIPMIHYGIPFTLGDGERTAMWLRVYGTQAVVVSGPKSRDAYSGDWKDPHKFDGILPELWRSGDDVIYGVPQRSTGLAYVVRAEHIVRRAPAGVEDVASVEAYAIALEDTSLPSIEANWTGANKATFKAKLASHDYISVQVACHEGWSALSQDRTVDIECDALGFIVLKPLCEGACEIQLTFDGGIPAKLTSISSGAVILMFVVWFTLDHRRQRTAASLQSPRNST